MNIIEKYRKTPVKQVRFCISCNCKFNPKTKLSKYCSVECMKAYRKMDDTDHLMLRGISVFY